MDELVRQASQKVGISEEQAKAAVETALRYLKDNLPVPIGGQIGGVLGDSGLAGGLVGVTGGLGGILGRK